MGKPTRKAERVTVKNGSKRRSKGSIRVLPGSTSILVVAPHGVFGDDDYTSVIAEALNKPFGCYAIINEQFRRPRLSKGELSNLKRSILDLNIISHAEQSPGDRYLGCLEDFTNAILEGGSNPIIIFLHGIEDDNIKKAAEKIAPEKAGKKPLNLDALIGFGQHKDKKLERLTARPETVLNLIESLHREGLRAAKAPTEPIDVKGKPKWYCGWEHTRMNQYFYGSKLPTQSIQLEIKKKGFRDDPDTARKTAEHLGRALLALIPKESEPASPPREFRTTLSEKSEVREIKVGEIDLEDTRFQSRTPEYGTDEKKFNELVASIKSEGVLNNIIVREVKAGKKYQLISGFRRLTALRKVYEDQGRQAEFLTAEVPAKIFKSITDEEALRISFSENLARKDLTLWETANHCRMLADKLTEQSNTKGEIEDQLAGMTHRDARTIRRYLALSSIQNERIRRDLHSGTMDASIGIVFTREGLTEKDRDALHRLYRRSPMPFRSLDTMASNALKLKEWSDLSVEKILEIPTASEFLSIPPDELKERTQYLSKTRNKPVEYILAHEGPSLRNPVERMKTRDEFEPFTRRFSQKATAIQSKISKLLKEKKVSGEVALSSIGSPADKMIKFTISAPASDLQKVIQLTGKELKDDFLALASLMHKPPKQIPHVQKAEERKVITDKDVAVAFDINLREFQAILGDLARDDDPENELRGQVLMRTISDNRVQFGCSSRSDLVITAEAKIHKEGTAAFLLKEALIPLKALKGDRTAECQIEAKHHLSGASKGKDKRTRISVLGMKWGIQISALDPDPLTAALAQPKRYKAHMRVDASDLKGMLKGVLPCINPSEIRKAMAAVHFFADEENLTLTGTNGEKLFEMVRPHYGLQGPPQELLVPYYTGDLLRKMIRQGTGAIRVNIVEKSICFQSENMLLVGNLILGESYPNYSPFFKKADNYFKIPVARLKDMAESAVPFGDPEDNHRVSITLNRKNVSLGNDRGRTTWSSEDAEGQMDLDINVTYLFDLAKSMEGDELEVRYFTGASYIIFHPDNGSQRAILTIVKRRSEEKSEAVVQTKTGSNVTVEKKVNPKKRPFGTKEWSAKSVNCCDGCSHDCLYCYGKQMAARRSKGRIPIDEWKAEKVRAKDVEKKYGLHKKGRIMFPSVHDITPTNLEACMTVLGKLLRAGNEVLIVSKPHYECIALICHDFGEFKDKILFRFTIGARDNEILSFWEPNAPAYEERIKCLKFAFGEGFKTSVSAEPMLDSEEIDALVKDLEPYVNDAIWIGKMNDVRRRVAITDENVEREVRKIEAGQTDDRIKAIYEKMKDHPKIKWKGRIKEVVGIPAAEKPGMDV